MLHVSLIAARRLTRPAGILHNPSSARNLCPAPVGPLEQVPVLRPLGRGLFHCVCVHDQGEIGVDLLVRDVAVEPVQRLARLIEVSVADLPPGRLRGEVATNHDGNGPNPLNRKRQAVRPLTVEVENAAEGAGRDDLAGISSA